MIIMKTSPRDLLAGVHYSARQSLCQSELAGDVLTNSPWTWDWGLTVLLYRDSLRANCPELLVSIIVEKTGSTSGTPWLVSVFVLFAVLGQDRINDNDNDNECHWADCQLIGTTLENNSGSDDGQIEWHCDTPPLLITSYRAWEWADTPYDIVLNIKPGKAAGGIMAY